MNRDELREHRLDHNRVNSWWMNDAKGIPLCRVCDECEEAARREYKPEVLGDSGNYEDVVEEPIEPEDADASFDEGFYDDVDETGYDPYSGGWNGE